MSSAPVVEKTPDDSSKLKTFLSILRKYDQPHSVVLLRGKKQQLPPVLSLMQWLMIQR
jgi:hypothetical protein